MAGEKFYIALPSVEALLLMKGREAAVKTVVQELGLVDYRNSYTKTFHEDLVTLFCDPAPPPSFGSAGSSTSPRAAPTWPEPGPTPTGA